MLKSYFFVPANNQKFIEKSKSLSANRIVFDLEDAILNDELINCYKNLSIVQPKSKHFVRFCFFDIDSNLDYKNFLVPKFGGIGHLQIIQEFLQKRGLKLSVNFILLIEHPKALINLSKTLQNNMLQINGIGLGSRDYCNEMGIYHTSKNLYYARQTVLTNAKAFEIEAIDTVSMKIENDMEFKKECFEAFQMGFDGKFLIHPHQLDIMHQIHYYTDTEINEASRVYDKILELQKHKAAVIRFEGKVYEKPYINRILNIIKWRDSYGNK